MVRARNNLLATHGSLWAIDPWYRRAWFVGPQAAALLAAGSLVWSVTSVPSPEKPVPWASPIPSARSWQDWDALRDKAKSDRSVFEMLKGLAEAGDPAAEFAIGSLYDPIFKLSQLVAPSIDVAISWYLKAAEQGHQASQIDVAQLFYNNQYGRAPDYEKAFYWNEKAADQGNLIGIHNASALLSNGQGVPKDLSRAFRLLTDAAMGGYPLSQLELGLIYKNGNDIVKPNPIEAAKWLEKSATNNNLKAINLIGIAYAQGNGVERNIDRARYWFKRGADGGDKDAAANLPKLPPN